MCLVYQNFNISELIANFTNYVFQIKKLLDLTDRKSGVKAQRRLIMVCVYGH